MRRSIIICLLLAGITLAIYWPAGHYAVVFYDDTFFTDNPEVQSGLNAQSFIWAMTGVVAANWHPVTSLSFVLTHQLFGTNAGADHLVNVVIHALNAALLFLVLQYMTGSLRTATSVTLDPTLQKAIEKRRDEIGNASARGDARPTDITIWQCAVVAALFAWHPLRVESVAWIAERKDVLCGFFVLLSILCYAKFASESKVQGPKSKVFYGLSLLGFALALLSKAMAVTLPFVLLLLDLWPLGRVQGSGFRVQGSGAKPLNSQLSTFNFQLGKRLIVEKIPFFVLTVIFCVVTFLVQRGDAATASLQELGPGLRLENIVVSYLRYLGWSVWPGQLAMFYSFPYDSHCYLALWPDWVIVAAALLMAAFSGLCVRQLSRRPYLAVGWFWYLGMMVPVIGLVQVGSQGMADRYTYLPLIGPVISLVWLVSEFWKSLRTSVTLDPTFPKAEKLKPETGNPKREGEGDGEVKSGNWNATSKNTSAREELAVGKPPPPAGWKTCPTSATSVTLDPTFPKAEKLKPETGNPKREGEGDGEVKSGKRKAESGSLRTATKMGITTLVMFVLAACIFQTRHQLQFWKNSEILSQHTIDVTGQNTRAEYIMGLSLERAGRFDEALVHYRNAVSAKPRITDAFAAIGRIFGQQGNWTMAEKTYAAMLGDNPNDFTAHLGLATALPQLGRGAEAAPHLQAALKVCPDSPDMLNNLAWTLATSSTPELRDGVAAVKCGERACELTGYRETVMVGTLGAAYAEAGRFDDALATAQKACALATELGKPELLQINQHLLELYRQHQPYREAAAK